MTCDNFTAQVWKWDSTVDLVIFSVLKYYDDMSLRNLPEFCDAVLKSGAYWFFILAQHHYVILEIGLRVKQFDVIDSPYPIDYDIESMKRIQKKLFPQCSYDIAIIPKRPESHPNVFKRLLKEDQSVNLPRNTVCLASMLNVKPWDENRKLPKYISAIYKTEERVQAFSHIIKMLCPHIGKVLDPIEG